MKLIAEDKPETMVSPPYLSATTNPLLTSDWARGNLLRGDKQRFANLPNDLRIISVLKTVVRGQYFATIDEAELAKLTCLGSCRAYTFPRDDDISKAK